MRDGGDGKSWLAIRNLDYEDQYSYQLKIKVEVLENHFTSLSL
jgi:hypothetical protein